jgi:SAM-dependent methyltransferase
MIESEARVRGVRDGDAGPAVTHCDDEYDSRTFALLREMQSAHFWYRGRHRFLLHAVRGALRERDSGGAPSRIIDLGGGCGGWIEYLLARARFPISEIALADSSELALELADQCLPSYVDRIAVDLIDLPWRARWDVAFMLDVLEHIPDHARALGQAQDALAPGGLLFVTVPALAQFWSWNDEFCRHQRRYSRQELIGLAESCGFVVKDARYFQFFLSPLLLLSRFAASSRARAMTPAQRRSLAFKMHAVPHPLVNTALGAIFACETPLGYQVSFPWGTSLMAVLERSDRGSWS